MRQTGIALLTALMAVFFFIGTAGAHDDDHKGKGHDKDKAHMEEGSGSSKMDKHSDGSEYKDDHEGEGSGGEKAGMRHHDDDDDEKHGNKMGHEKEGSGMKDAHSEKSH